MLAPALKLGYTIHLLYYMYNLIILIIIKLFYVRLGKVSSGSHMKWNDFNSTIKMHDI